MYTFILKNRKFLIVDRYIFATYGHNSNDQSIISHNYFGTEKVIQDLRKFDSYSEGLIELTPDMFHRDLTTGLINNISGS